MEWRVVADLIAPVERAAAMQDGLRVVSVATNATRLPAKAADGRVVHPGRFGGWVLEAAELEGDLVAVLRFSDGSLVGIKADGSEVGVSNE